MLTVLAQCNRRHCIVAINQSHVRTANVTVLFLGQAANLCCLCSGLLLALQVVCLRHLIILSISARSSLHPVCFERVAVCLRLVDGHKRGLLQGHVYAILRPYACTGTFAPVFQVDLMHDQVLVSTNSEHLSIIGCEDRTLDGAVVTL